MSATKDEKIQNIVDSLTVDSASIVQDLQQMRDLLGVASMKIAQVKIKIDTLSEQKVSEQVTPE